MQINSAKSKSAIKLLSSILDGYCKYHLFKRGENTCKAEMTQN